VAILDADKEGFLRSEVSLIQTIGRAARNSAGEVLMYADVITGSIERAIKETDRRRKIQVAYNKEHNITPTTIIKKISDILPDIDDNFEIGNDADTEIQNCDAAADRGERKRNEARSKRA